MQAEPGVSAALRYSLEQLNINQTRLIAKSYAEI